MQLWTMNSARATIGGPILESRTPCNAASFHCMNTFGDCASVGSAQMVRIVSVGETMHDGLHRALQQQHRCLRAHLGTCRFDSCLARESIHQNRAPSPIFAP